MTRHEASLIDLLNSVHLVAASDPSKLASWIVDFDTNECGRNEIKDVVLIDGGIESVQELLVTGLLELCKMKPVGNDAIQRLGEWLLENNPNKNGIVKPSTTEDNIAFLCV